MKGQYVPEIGTTQFVKFAAHGHALISEVTKEHVQYKVDVNSMTAYFDRDHQMIALPGWYFLPEGVQKFASENESMGALSLINGSTIHEALHAKWTKVNPAEMTRNAERRLGHSLSPELAGIIANVIEDVIIENSRSVKGYQKAWLAAKNDLLFNDKIFAETVENFDGTNPLVIAQTLAFFKRESLQSKLAELVDPKIVEVLDELKTKNTACTVEQRVDAMVEIINLITTLAEETKASKTSGTDGDSEGTEDDGETSEGETTEAPESEETSEGEGKSEEKPEENPFEPKTSSGSASETKAMPKNDGAEGAMGEVAKEVEKLVEENKKEVSKAAQAFEKEVEREAREKEVTDQLERNDGTLNFLAKNIKVSEVSKVSYNDGELMKIEFSNRFVQLLKQMRTVLPTHGRGKITGGKLDVLRLHQVAIDNKVFSQRTIESAGNNDKIEMIILVDASGSMGRHVGGGRKLFDQCISVTHKIFSALVNANVSSQVFAHTSYGGNLPHLIKIADNTTKNFTKKFELALGLGLAENLDGVIINEIVKNHFVSDSRTQKVLLVLSDGSPQSPNYPNYLGVPHTTSVVENARKMGVKVYSISLVEEVVKGNNRIYGADYNIDASKNLDKEMVNLVTKLVRQR